MRAMRLLPALLLLTACSADATPPAFTARDSAGVRIVEYAGEPPSAVALEVAPTPLFRVGDEPGEREWGAISDLTAAIRPDGGAIVFDAVTREVVALGPDGAVQTVLARGGEGPGEVRFVGSIQALGPDTVLVHDPRNAKVLVFARGALERTVATTNLTMATAVGRDGAALLLATSSYRELVDPWLQGHLIRFDLDTRGVDTVGTFDFRSFMPRQGPMNPFGAVGFAIGSGASFVIGRTDLPEVVWRASDGSVRQALRWNPVRSYATEADLQSFKEEARLMMPKMNPGMSAAQADQIIERQFGRYALDSTEPMPLFWRLMGDGEGGVWLAHYSAAGMVRGIGEWSVIGPDGEWRGRAALPDGLRVLAVSRDRVLGILTDSMDVQSVAMFELRPPTP